MNTLSNKTMFDHDAADKTLPISKRRKSLLRYIREHGWVKATCMATKLATGYPKRARKANKTYGHALKSLWLRGELEGIKINGAWHYTQAAPYHYRSPISRGK